jgi:transposase
VVPEWLRGVTPPVWFERYAHRVEEFRLPRSQEKREALLLTIGADGFLLLDALGAPTAPATAREVAMVGTLRKV